MLKEKKQSVAIWVGTLSKKSELNAYLKEHRRDEDDDRPISPFAGDLGTKFYDHDFVFGEWSSGKPKPIETLLQGWNYAASFTPAALKAARKLGLESGNAIIVAYDHRLSPAKWPERSIVKFLGNFSYSDDVPTPARAAVSVKGHLEPIGHIEFSPDGKLVVSGADDGSLIAWDPKSGAVVAAPASAFRKSLREIYYIGFSADGARCVGASQGGTCVWDPFPTATDCGQEMKEAAVRAVSPDGRFGYAPEIGKIRVLDLNSGKVVTALSKQLEGDELVLTPQGELITAEGDGVVRIWDCSTGKCRATLDPPEETNADDLVISPSGKLVATAASREAVVWNLAKQKTVAVIKAAGTFNEVALPDDKTLLALAPTSLEQFALPGGKPMRSLAHKGALAKDARNWKLTVARNGTVALVRLVGREFVDLWDLQAGKFLCRYPETKSNKNQAIDAAAISADGKTVALGLRDGKLHVFKLSGKRLTPVGV